MLAGQDRRTQMGRKYHHTPHLLARRTGETNAVLTPTDERTNSTGSTTNETNLKDHQKLAVSTGRSVANPTSFGYNTDQRTYTHLHRLPNKH